MQNGPSNALTKLEFGRKATALQTVVIIERTLTLLCCYLCCYVCCYIVAVDNCQTCFVKLYCYLFLISAGVVIFSYGKLSNLFGQFVLLFISDISRCCYI